MESKYNSKATRLADEVVRDIWNGRFSDGVLPAEETLGKMYLASRNTIRRVIDALVKNGILVKEPNHTPCVSPNLVHQTPGSVSREVHQVVIGALWSCFPDIVTMKMCDGIGRYASGHGMKFQLFQSIESNDKAAEYLENVDALDVDGLLVMAYGIPQYTDALERLRERRFPVVLLDHPVEGIDLPCVYTDIFGGVFRATSQLMAGARGPACYFGPRHVSENINHKFIYDAYLRAVMDAGLLKEAARHSYFVDEADSVAAYWPSEHKMDPLLDTARRLLSSEAPPAAVMCCNDYFAQAVYMAAEESGMRVGRDVLVWGLCDIPFGSANPHCSLSTIRQPHEDVGYEAARMLDEMLKGRLDFPLNKVLPVELVERDSSRFSQH